MEKSKVKVCVTGAAGYIASHLVRNLLQRGYTVHATLRNLDDKAKVGLLKGFAGADERLRLFKADIYGPHDFVLPIRGCLFVFHVATPLLHTPGSKYGNRVDATVDAARCIAAACIESGTVRRLIYTGSVTAASPLKEDGIGFNEVMDESCWTPLVLPNNIPYGNDFVMEYTTGKTLAEKELLSYNDTRLEVVSLTCGLVGGGDVLLPHLPSSVAVFLAQLTGDEITLNSLKFLQELLGKVPIVHVEDVCNAHIFCATEGLMIKGRFLCANGYISTSDIARYYENKYPEFCHVVKKHLEGPEYETKWGSNLLGEMGFEYKYDWQRVLDDCIVYARKLGHPGV